MKTYDYPGFKKPTFKWNDGQLGSLNHAIPRISQKEAE